jgi:anti-anti-sigma factor
LLHDPAGPRWHLPPPFTCVADAAGGIAVTGELDLATAPELDLAIAEAGGRSSSVVVDLRGLTFIDSAGVHSLTAGADAADGHAGHTFRVVPGPERVQRVLRLTDTLERLAVGDPPA